MKTINLKQLSVDELLALRLQINDMLKARVGRERRDSEARLKRLQQFKTATRRQDDGRKTKRRADSKKQMAKKKKTKSMNKVAPKYRNPDNPSETWSGRGLHPR